MQRTERGWGRAGWAAGAPGLILLLLALSAAVAGAADELIGFDDLPNGTVVKDQYAERGVRFGRLPGETASDYAALAGESPSATSPPNIAQLGLKCPPRSFTGCTRRTEAALTASAGRVALQVVTAQTGSAGASVLLEALDSAGQTIGQDRMEVAPGEATSERLEVLAPSGQRIWGFRLQMMETTSSSTPVVGFDDLLFDRPDPDPTPDPAPGDPGTPPAGEPVPPAAGEPVPPAAGEPVLTEQALDPDADGEAEHDDACPGGSGKTEIVPGCSLRQALARPQVLVAEPRSAAANARSLFRSLPKLREGAVSRFLKRSAARLAKAADGVERGDVCAGAGHARGGLALLKRGTRQARKSLRRFDTRVAPRQRSGHGDSDGYDFQLAAADARRRALADARGAAGELTRRLTKLCRRQSSPRTWKARVESVDTAASELTLAGGKRILLGPLAKGIGIQPGVEVEVHGRGLKGIGVLADDIAAVKGKPGHPTLSCFDLRVVPYQLGEPNVHHDYRGYSHDGALLLEPATRFSVSEKPHCPRHAPEGTYFQYTADIQLSYDKIGGGNWTRRPIAIGLRPGQVSPSLPDDVQGTKATLRLITTRTTCTPKFQAVSVCEKPLLHEEQKHEVYVRRPFHYGTASYEQRSFLIEDWDNGSFGVTQFQWFKGSGSSAELGAGAKLEGLGYVDVGGKSSRPNIHTIPEGGSFAVHNQWGQRQAATDFKGIRGGLVAARVSGSRNGHPYWYSAQIDQVVTDATCRCFPDPDGFYRLPWAPGTTQRVTQGNNTTFTHKGGQRWAYDFSHPMGTPIYAARGGWVARVVETEEKTSDPTECAADKDKCEPANQVRIEHMDGTVGVYVHLRYRGVEVAPETFVRRGELLGYSGNTGNSTGPHLHFHVTNKSQNDTVPLRFETGSPSGAAVDCVLLRKADEPYSNNG